MDWGLFTEVAGLGLAAIDAIGIAFMPILLAQRDGLQRALVFLLGSFVALVAMGMLFTTGIGTYVADLNERHPWLEPGVEVVGGLVMVGLGTFLVIRSRTGAAGTHTPDNLVEKLTLPPLLLFGFVAVLVSVQSLVDIVFAVAMVEIGAEGLAPPVDLLLVITYAVFALLLQTAVVLAYVLTPRRQRASVMAAFTDWLVRRGEFWAGLVALLFGIGLLIFSGPDLIQALDA
jgi:hypothetical protein